MLDSWDDADGVPLLQELVSSVPHAKPSWGRARALLLQRNASFPVPAKLEPVQEDATLAMDGSELCALLRPVLARHLEQWNFDSLALAEAFLTAPAGAAHHDVRALDLLYAYGGTHCVGLAEHLVLELRALGVPAFVCAGAALHEPCPGRLPPLGHAAVMVRFRSPVLPQDHGWVLLDPGLNLAAPVVIRPSVPSVLHHAGESWVVESHQDQGTVVMESSRRSRLRARLFLARQWCNPDASLSAFEHLKEDFKLVRRSPSGEVLTALVVDVERGSVLLRSSGSRQRCGLHDAAGLRRLLSAGVAAALNVSRAVLLQRVERVAQGQERLLRARLDT